MQTIDTNAKTISRTTGNLYTQIRRALVAYLGRNVGFEYSIVLAHECASEWMFGVVHGGIEYDVSITESDVFIVRSM